MRRSGMAWYRRRLRALRAAAAGMLSVAVCVAGAQARPGEPAAEATPTFRQLGHERSFQSDVITEVMRDRIGFLWIGTREGLFLHDGQRFRKFEHAVNDAGSLSSSGVRALLEDAQGRLWIATITGGLNLLDRATWRFRHWRSGGDGQGPSHDGIFALAEAGGGRLWVGTQGGLDLFDPVRDRFTRIPVADGGEFVMTLLRDRRGRLWVGTLGHGLYRSDDQGSSFVPVTAAGGAALTEDVFTLAEDTDGGIWVGTRSGLFRVSASDAGVLVEPALSPQAVLDELVNVTEIQPTPDGGLWLGTFGAGMHRIDASHRSIRYVPLGIDGPPGQHIDQGALELDAHGGLFVGTFGGGLLRTSDRTLSLQQWREQGEAGRTLTFEDVYLVRADGRGGAWLGSFGGGVDHLVLPEGRVTPLPLPITAALKTVVGGVLDLQRAGDGTLWVATSRGVYRYHPQRRAFRHYQRRDAATAYAFSMLIDRARRVWVGTAGGGLLLYQPDRDDFAQFRPEPANPQSLSSDFLTVLMEDRNGRLWIGTRSGGVDICALRGTRLECRNLARAGNGLGHDHVTSLLEAPDGSVLVGTAGGGLHRLWLDAGGGVARVRRWSRSDGLMDDNVMALVFAPDGALWISTRAGLSRIETASGRIENYGTTHGLPNTVFNPKAVAAIGGRLLWGTQQGAIAVDTASRPQPAAPPPTVIAAVAGLPADLQPARPAWALESLRLPFRQPFSLELAVLGFDGGDPEYQYRLAETDPWTGLDDRGQLLLHALAPGNYRLQVRGRRAGSAWTAARPIRLSIVPPWWQRPLLQAALLGTLLALLLGALGWRLHLLRRRHRELQRIHAEREQALREAQESGARLEEAFANLRRMTMKLEAAKEEERNRLARELHDEFGQALTAAKINLQLVRGNPHAAGADVRIDETVRMVEDLIAQVRALSFELRPPLLDELGLVPALDGYLAAAAQRSGLPISTELPPNLPPLGAEREIMLFRIVQEAVTNALRHADARALWVTLRTADDGVTLEIQDDGRGFDPAAVAPERNGGFGLLGMRERVHELGGTFTLQASPGAGTRIVAVVPTPHGGQHARRAG